MNYLTQAQNPGPGNRTTLLAPISFALEPEVWRVFFISIGASLAGGPTSNFFFALELTYPPTADNVTISSGEVLPAAQTDHIVVGLNSALLLPTSSGPTPGAPSGLPPFSINIQLFQNSGPAANDFLVDARFYILRNPRGVAHYL